MNDYKQYKRKGLSEMRPYVEGGDLAGVSISEEDKANGSPKQGDMIARNPKNHEDKWLVAEKYFKENLEIAGQDSVRVRGHFGFAISALKRGERVTRRGWNGKGMFIYLVEGTTVALENLRGAAQRAVKASDNTAPVQDIGSHIDMLAADGSIVVGWLASQTDMLADDWVILE